MSYTALYRKFRPQTFEDVKGQDIIVSALKNQIAAGRVGHAFLFTGTRGVGKTTAAKLLARAVNCENPKDGDPCGECEMCKKILAGTSMNVVEMDAASNNSVENIREIIDEVEYSPTEGKYKVYIIDEVHMLSGSAFNALLKTLEEPPSYVIFILATTEAHKIPITILSRCQRYDFRRASTEEIMARLRTLTDTEHVAAEDKALKYIATLADGSFRDGISLLDKCISFYLGEELTYDRVLGALGTVDAVTYKKLISAIRVHDVNAALKTVDEIVRSGKELTQFAEDFTWYMRDLLVAKASGNTDFVEDIPSDEMAGFKEEVGETSIESLSRYIRIFSKLTNDIKLSSAKRVETEVAVIKLCAPETEKTDDSVFTRLTEVEKKIENGVVYAGNGNFANGNFGNGNFGNAGVMSANAGAYGANMGAYGAGAGLPNQALTPEQQAEQKEKLKERIKALPEDLKNILASWDEIKQDFKGLHADFASAVVAVSEDNKLIVNLKATYMFDYWKKDNYGVDYIKDLIYKKFGKDVEVEIRCIDNKKNNAEPAENADFVALMKEIGEKNIPVEIEE